MHERWARQLCGFSVHGPTLWQMVERLPRSSDGACALAERTALYALAQVCGADIDALVEQHGTGVPAVNEALAHRGAPSTVQSGAGGRAEQMLLRDKCNALLVEVSLADYVVTSAVARRRARRDELQHFDKQLRQRLSALREVRGQFHPLISPAKNELGVLQARAAMLVGIASAASKQQSLRNYME